MDDYRKPRPSLSTRAGSRSGKSEASVVSIETDWDLAATTAPVVHPIRENRYQNRYQVRPPLPGQETLIVTEVASMQVLC